MIEVNERIDVPSTPRAVWEVLSNPHAVVECVPGASLGELQEDGYYDAGLLVKFGPAKVTFKARFMLELDEPSMSGTVTSRGKDKSASAISNVTSSSAIPRGSEVFLESFWSPNCT